jgi:ATP synthase F1 delta subunit
MSDPNRPYAQALLEATRPLGLSEEADLLIEGYIDYVESNPEAITRMTDPGRKTSARDRALAVILGAVAESMGREQGEFDPKTVQFVLNLLRLMKARGRATNLRPMLENFRSLRNEADGVVMATVASARALNHPETQRLQEVIEDRFLSAEEKALKRKVFINAEVDQSLLAGLRVRVGDAYFDDTLKTRMGRMKRHLS